MHIDNFSSCYATMYKATGITYTSTVIPVITADKTMALTPIMTLLNSPNSELKKTNKFYFHTVHFVFSLLISYEMRTSSGNRIIDMKDCFLI